MLKINERLNEPAEPAATLTLPFEQRRKSRLRAELDGGEEVALMLPRGTVLRGGDLLRAESGLVIRVQAAPEPVSTAFSKDPHRVARACYHLGNRHVELEIGDTWLRYAHDHVLDHMVEELGLRVFFEYAPFEPEAGAYAAHGHGAHTHEHGEHHDH